MFKKKSGLPREKRFTLHILSVLSKKPKVLLSSCSRLGQTWTKYPINSQGKSPKALSICKLIDRCQNQVALVTEGLSYPSK